jgi:hypothetical protein
MEGEKRPYKFFLKLRTLKIIIMTETFQFEIQLI